MEIKIESRHLQDVVVLVPDIFQDSRGFFMETFREDQFKAHELAVSLCARQPLALGERSGSRFTLSMGAADGQTDARYGGQRIPGSRGYP